MNTPENLVLLRTAVNAKLAYWDALDALGTALTVSGGAFDHANSAMMDQIDLLAAGVDQVTMAHLEDTIKIVSAT